MGEIKIHVMKLEFEGWTSNKIPALVWFQRHCVNQVTYVVHYSVSIWYEISSQNLMPCGQEILLLWSVEFRYHVASL